MEGKYKAEKRETIAEAPGIRVRRITLAPGDAVPWHHHTEVTDTIVCLEGRVVVETRAPDAKHTLAPGESVAVPPRCPHTVHGDDMGRCQFIAIQGVGKYDFVPAKG